MKNTLVLLPFLVVLFALSAIAEAQRPADPENHGTLVKFQGGIGVIPVASAVGRPLPPRS